MTTPDIVTRLKEFSAMARQAASMSHHTVDDYLRGREDGAALCADEIDEAADEIERLRKDIGDYRESLRLEVLESQQYRELLRDAMRSCNRCGLLSLADRIAAALKETPL